MESECCVLNTEEGDALEVVSLGDPGSLPTDVNFARVHESAGEYRPVISNEVPALGDEVLGSDDSIGSSSTNSPDPELPPSSFHDGDLPPVPALGAIAWRG